MDLWKEKLSHGCLVMSGPLFLAILLYMHDDLRACRDRRFEILNFKNYTQDKETLI